MLLVAKNLTKSSDCKWLKGALQHHCYHSTPYVVHAVFFQNSATKKINFIRVSPPGQGRIIHEAGEAEASGPEPQ